MKLTQTKVKKTPVKFSPNSLILLNADYIDDDGKLAKQRWHLIIEVNERQIRLLKITSRWKNYFFQSKLGLLKCLKKPSYVIHNRILVLELSSSISSQKFRLCQVHQKNCVVKERFAKIIRKLNKFWISEFSRDKKVIKLNLNNLKDIRNIKNEKN